MALNERQKDFAKQYLVDLNATKAAIRAGYNERSAYNQGARLMKNDEVLALIEELQQPRNEKLETDAEWVLRRLIEEANADIADLFDDNGEVKPISEWPAVWRTGLIAGIDVDAIYDGTGKDRKVIGHTKRIKISDRIKRIEMIGKHTSINAFRERVAVEPDGELKKFMKQVSGKTIRPTGE